MQPRILFPTLLTSLLVCTAAAQRTWIVDYRGGPGVDFTDIPPAVAAAATGDTILIENGLYSSPQIVGKGLTLAGRTGAFAATGLTEIRGIPVGVSVTLVGMDQTFGAMQCRDCAGTIHLQSCFFGRGCASSLFGLHTYVDCARITMHRTVLYGTSAPIEFTRSNVYATDCLFEAGGHWCGFGGGAPGISHAVRMEDSRLEMTRSILAGAGSGSFQQVGTAPVTMLRSTLIAGEGSWIYSGSCLYARPLVGSRDSTVVTDPGVWWNCTTNAAVLQNVTLSQRIVTSVWTLAARWGVHVDVTVRSEPYALTVLVADFPTVSAPQATPYGNLWFDPSRALVLGAFAMPGGGFARMRVPLSTSLPPLTMLAFQAVALRSSGQFELSLPAIVSVLP